jgi:hypothetical protein
MRRTKLLVMTFGTLLVFGLVVASNPCRAHGGAITAASVLLPLLAVVAAINAVRLSDRRVDVATTLGLVFGAYFVLIRCGAPFELRWKLSRSAFDSAVAHRSGPIAPKRLGLFGVEEPRTAPDGAVRFDLSGGDCGACGICMGCGVVWLPAGAQDHATVLDPLGGSWYRFRDCT